MPAWHAPAPVPSHVGTMIKPSATHKCTVRLASLPVPDATRLASLWKAHLLPQLALAFCRPWQAADSPGGDEPPLVHEGDGDQRG
jgi:hypothetical protein